MSRISLREGLSVLSKSSPFAVSTVWDRPNDQFDFLKKYLFVEQKIETDFVKVLSSLDSNQIVFLCGSSGDGKSEILARHHKTYSSKFRFHLDATHSFSPRQSAIQTLDDLFDQHKQDVKPTVIGINVGMLANYAIEGAGRHADIKDRITAFLSNSNSTHQRPYFDDVIYFLNFENYPKFQFSSDPESYSTFAKALIKKLTSSSEQNPFYQLYLSDLTNGFDAKLLANYELLSLDSVQNFIVSQLFKVRLIRDQFITTRALLDLLHDLLLGSGYLFDNLYLADQNELVRRIADFDPARIHTKELDQFVLKYELNLPDVDLEVFLSELQKKNFIFARGQAQKGDAASLIRLFSILRRESLGNNYHHIYKEQFEEKLLEEYVEIWRLHSEYDGSVEQKRTLRNFYSGMLVTAIQRYANRNAPFLAGIKDEFFLGTFGPVNVTAPLDIKGDYDAIIENDSINNSRFIAYLKVDDIKLPPISIGLNLFDLIQKLNSGYRPSKYDKNAIVLLDEIVERVLELSKESSSFKFYDEQKSYIVKEDDGMIAVGGVN